MLLGGAMDGGILHETAIGRACRIRNAIIDKNVEERKLWATPTGPGTAHAAAPLPNWLPCLAAATASAPLVDRRLTGVRGLASGGRRRRWRGWCRNGRGSDRHRRRSGHSGSRR